MLKPFYVTLLCLFNQAKSVAILVTNQLENM